MSHRYIEILLITIKTFLTAIIKFYLTFYLIEISLLFYFSLEKLTNMKIKCLKCKNCKNIMIIPILNNS
jgi:hypothetical protein